MSAICVPFALSAEETGAPCMLFWCVDIIFPRGRCLYFTEDATHCYLKEESNATVWYVNLSLRSWPVNTIRLRAFPFNCCRISSHAEVIQST